MKHRVLVSDQLNEKGLALFRNSDDFEADMKTGLEPAALRQVIPGYHALVIRSATKVTRDILEAATDLKVIGRAGTGLDNVDIAEATRRGIVVMNTPGGNSEATAEHTISLIMAMHRHIPQAVASLKEGRWDKKKFQGREMEGRRLGVIGLGKVGSLVCKIGSRGLRMKVMGFDPVASQEAAAQVGATLTDLDRIFAESDVITVHTPLNDATRNLIDAKAFEKMKDGVMIVNCARGGIVNEADLLAALESGKVAAAALDVYSQTPPGDDNPLVNHPRVVTTPHLGASTSEAQENVAVAVVEQIMDYLAQGIVRNAVNVPTVSTLQAAKMGPYLDLARRLAQFLGGLAPSAISEMQVEFLGEIATWDHAPITNAALVGLLRRFEGMEVNDVNAGAIAKERGIRISETTLREGQDYASALGLKTVSSDGASRYVQGTLIQRDGLEPRIIAIDNFVTEAVPAGPMLIVRNRDTPGMVAGMSRKLADGGVNIAQMNLSRDAIGGTAVSIINTDEAVDESVIEAISAIDGIMSVQQVILY